MSLRCHTPPEMRGRYLAQLDDRVMRCPTVAVERRVRQGQDPTDVTTGSATSSGATSLAGETTASFLISFIPTKTLVMKRLTTTALPTALPTSLPTSLIISKNAWWRTTTLVYSETYSTLYHYVISAYCSWRIFVTLLLLSLFYNCVLSFHGTINTT